MATSFHKDQHTVPVYHGLPGEVEIHGLFSFVYTDAATRLAAVGFDTTHVGKVAWQQDNNSFWVLINLSPIQWKPFGAGYSELGLKCGKLIPGAFSGTPKKATVTFATPYLSTAYEPVVHALTDGTKSYNPSIESKTTTGFVVNLNSNNLAGLVEAAWHTLLTGE
jgi:hypothetical protein